MPDLPAKPSKTGVRLFVRLTPKSARDSVDGCEDGPSGPVLRTRVRAVPEKGKANQALAVLIATWIGVAKSCVAVAAGHTSRYKTVEIAGESDELLAAIAEKLET